MNEKLINRLESFDAETDRVEDVNRGVMLDKVGLVEFTLNEIAAVKPSVIFLNFEDGEERLINILILISRRHFR